MVTVQDPAREFASIVADRRADRAADIGSRFRLDIVGVECASSFGDDKTNHALIGASARALKPDMVDDTVRLIGLVGGLLADLGFEVCPVGVRRSAGVPALVTWICGDDTGSDEFIELDALDAPGISLGSCVDGLDGWMFLESDELHDRQWFTRRFVDEVRSLVDLPD